MCIRVHQLYNKRISFLKHYFLIYFLYFYFLLNFLKACEKCKNEKRKTINGDDLIYAMNTLGFDNYIDILKLYLQKYREVYLLN